MNTKDLVSFKLTNNKIAIELITSINDKNTLQPINFRWGGIQKHVNDLTKVTL